MTNREKALTKPPQVQIVLKVLMTHTAIDDPDPDWEEYCGLALDYWAEVVEGFRHTTPALTEIEAATHLIERIQQSNGVWADILHSEEGL